MHTDLTTTAPSGSLDDVRQEALRKSRILGRALAVGIRNGHYDWTEVHSAIECSPTFQILEIVHPDGSVCEVRS